MSTSSGGRRILIIVPTYNERANIESFLHALLATLPEANVLVVDDNSPDKTGELVDALAKQDTRIHALHRAGKLGLGTAYIEGFNWGIERGYDWFFEMDADFSHDPKYLQDFVAALENGADVVVGSRNIEGGRVEGWGIGRQLISKGGSLYARTALGVGVHDLTTGYKAFTRETLEGLNLRDVKSTGYGFQIEMTFRALRRERKVVEVPIVFVDRRAGQSKMSTRIFMEALLVVWKLRWDAVVGRL
ncbi:MAG TPA: polyprenol monophosphomannose synthase [Polyangiaceae bacterium]